MRYLVFLTCCLLTSIAVSAQGLAALEPDAGPETFMEELESFMTDSKDRNQQEAYANFNGVFYGGLLGEDLKKRVMNTATRLAAARISAQSGYQDYLKTMSYLAQDSVLVVEYHNTLDALLDEPKVKVNRINTFLAGGRSFMETRKLGDQREERGWSVIGGKARFAYREGQPMLLVDTIQRIFGMGNNDTLVIEETQLAVDMVEKVAYGKGGRVDWQGVGLEQDIFALLVNYQFDVNRTQLTSDSAQLQYPDYFGDKIMVGKYTNKIQPGGARSGSNYPQFLSSDGFVEIENVGEGINLFGNFELRGGTVYAIGDAGRSARVTLDITDENDDKGVVARAKRFAVKSGERVSGQDVETIIRFGQDSLFHPSVTFRAKVDERTVSLSRTETSSGQSPFYHSANNLHIYADHLDLFLNQDSAVVGKKTVSFQEKSDVVFQSKDFYREIDYVRLQNIARTNPLEVIYAYRIGPEGGNDVIDANILALKFDPRHSAGNIEPLLFELEAQGFLSYDPEKEEVTLKEKLSHYVRASREEVDYDRLRLVSQTKEINGFMDMKTGEIRIESVQPIELNREKRIAIKPLGSQVVVNGDRNFDFSGQVIAGGLVMEGKDFHYRHEPYHVKLDSVRYLDIFVPEGDYISDEVERLSTGSRVEHLSGYLLIDAPKNKSGTEDIGYFPSLQSKEVSYIYYDQGDSLADYTRDSFFFELQPFSLNGVDSLLASQIELDGSLNSGGIFPSMEETLTVQEDGSLGFITETPEGGQGTYGDRGRYEGEVVLSNRGLEGKGKLNYLEAEINSEDLKFGLGRTTASAREFNLEESVSGDRTVPQVRGTEVNIVYKPYADSLDVKSAEDAPFDLFRAGEHTFDGSLVLTPATLSGAGTLGWDMADLSSESMSFGTFSATADTSNVRIKSLEGDDRLALRTTNVSAEVDFEKQSGIFQNNSEDLATILPYNQYSTSIDRFEWDMAKGNISFEAVDGTGTFTSIHPDQDDLTFEGTVAAFDINTSMFDIEGVPYIESADARIYPDSGMVRIEPGAKMTEMTNARIVADTINEYHVIERATVNVTGRKEYTASGFYVYNVGDHEQEVEFQKITGTRIGKGKRSEKATATRAEGTIAEGTEFFIDNKTKFFGTLNLDAGSKTLYFDGYAKLDTEKLPDAQWFTVQSEGDKKNLTLDIISPKDRDGLPLFTGMYLSKPNRRVYPSLIQTKDQRKDHAILDANGVVNYDEEKNAFLFGDSTRISDPQSVRGNLMAFDAVNGKVTGDGMLGIGGRLKYQKVSAYGSLAMDMPSETRVEIQADPEPVIEEPEDKKDDTNNFFLLEEETKDEETDEKSADDGITIDGDIGAAYPDLTVKAMTAIDLILPDKLVNMMATDVVSSSFAAPGLNLVTEREFYERGLKTLFPAGKERAAALSGLNSGAIDLKKNVNPHTFLFSQLDLQWNTDYQSFVSRGKLTGLASIKGNPVSKMVEAYVEIKMPTGGDDRLYIYLKSPSELYYFFGFKDGILNVVSNNTAFMNELETMKPKDLIKEMDDGEVYEILPVSPGTAATFLRRAQSAFGE